MIGPKMMIRSRRGRLLAHQIIRGRKTGRWNRTRCMLCLMSMNDVSGVALAFKDGRNVLEKGYGFRDLESYIPKPTHAASVSPQPA